MKVRNIHENAKRCICDTCPTYVMGDAGFFCGAGKSNKSLTKKGCVCGDCRNFTEYELKDGYFCFTGTAD